MASATRSNGLAMTPLPLWLQRAMLATAAMNAMGALTFTPWGRPIRALAELPEAPPVYLWIIAIFVLLFGIAYLVMGITGRGDRLLIAIAAAGKLSFFALLAVLWLAGELTIKAPLSAVGDLVFGALFVMWLVSPASPR
jgi:hypothetical protein